MRRREHLKSLRAVIVISLLSLAPELFGCGGARSQPLTLSGTMQDIEALELSIEEQRGLMAGGSECLDRCRAAESICDCSVRICEVAGDLAEAEAMESCRRAESYCVEARRHVDDECTCP